MIQLPASVHDVSHTSTTAACTTHIRMVDVGCGTGVLTNAMLEHMKHLLLLNQSKSKSMNDDVTLEVLGIDADRAMITQAQSQSYPPCVSFQQADIRS
jgi:trans-aconitate methyltransferase